MKKNYYLFLLLALCAYFSSFGQNVGDIALLQYNGDSSGTTFKFVTFVDIPAGTQINFTDNGWLSAGGFRSGEGIVTWTSPGVSCGDVISLTEAGGFALSTNGDQIIAYTGTFAAPTPIAAIQMNGNWDADATNANTSAIPTGLTNGVNCLSISPEIDNAEYNSAVLNGTIAVIRAAINNSSNWTTDNANLQDFTDTFTITDCGGATTTTVQFATTTTSINETGTFVDICVSITDPSATAATTVDITLDGSSTATNGTDYDDSAVAIAFPITLTFPAGSTADQCLSIFMADDALVEGNETVVLNLNNAAGGDSATLGVDTQHILTIIDDEATFPANVVITEIMYNSSGTDDEWIEICNVSGSTQVLNDYTIEVGGSLVFTFPSSGALINDGDCIIIDLGDGGGASYNADCPILPADIDYSNGAGTGTLNNTSDTIELIASDGTTIVDIVTYDDNDGSLTDNNGASFHIIDTSLDNSVTSTNWWQALNGGSPGTNSLISPCTPPGPEINVEGTTSGFPNIADGHTTPAFFDGTNFGDVTIGGTSTNTFRIENFGGTTDLTISSVTVSAGDVADFSISSLPGSPIAALDFSFFDIEFSPTVVGTRTATIEIRSNDGDEDPYTFTVEGNGLCAASTIVAQPASGPVNTIVTVTGTNLSTATASFNGVPATVTNISATEMEVIVPSGAATGNLEIIDDLGCPGTTPFTVIESQISSCEGSGGTTPTDLFISEVTDANTGGLTYIEIYNGTGGTINLGTYSIQFFNNGSATENGGSITLNNVNLVSGDTYVLAVSTGSNCTEGITGEDGSLADQTGFGGINFNVNGDDHIRLYDGATHIDSWGEYLSNTWADTLGIGSEGVVFRRDSNAPDLPDINFDVTDWTIVDWVSCADSDYSNIGDFDFSTGVPPNVTGISDLTTACNESTISVTASEGTPLGNALEYVWYAYNPAQAGLGWQALANGGIYSGADTASLVISDAASVVDFQFYCEVQEDDASCSTASEAIQITNSTATWDGTNWTWNDGTAIDTPPTLTSLVIIDAPFDTSVGGLQTSFNACSLTVTTGNTLAISNNTFVQIQNDIVSDGTINVARQGAVVQIDDTGSVSGLGTMRVTKQTAPMNNAYEYTYWSSPTNAVTINSALSQADVNRRFIFNAQNYLDQLSETNNNNATAAGPDDIDDDNNDWNLLSGAETMQAGVGYASTHDPTLFASTPGLPPYQFNYIFEGPFNNGVISVPLYRNDSYLLDNNWNFVGNPYPSAISVAAFFAENAQALNVNGATDGVIHFWSHDSAPLDTNNGNEQINFNQGDYATINSVGGTSSGNGSQIPNGFIPSGQGFFVAMDDTVTPLSTVGDIAESEIRFNNAMRVTGGNDQFFRDSNPDNKLWLNLTSDNGVFSQVLIAYTDFATATYDGNYIDAPRNLGTDVSTRLYSLIDDMNSKFVIQGKSTSDLSMDEVVKLGIETTIDVPTIYSFSIAQLEGQFLTDHVVYIKDNALNNLHDLKASDYFFNSEVGEFNERFEIVFNASALSINDYDIDAGDLMITEHKNGDVEFKVPNGFDMLKIEILDVVGRKIYSLNANNSIEVYNLNKLSRAAYIARVTLSDGRTLTKKAIKQR